MPRHAQLDRALRESGHGGEQGAKGSTEQGWAEGHRSNSQTKGTVLANPVPMALRRGAALPAFGLCATPQRLSDLAFR
jgi:hypothetical protein